MTVADLLALPVGRLLWWDLCRMAGQVTVRDADGLSIVWDDGQSTIVCPGDDDVAEFAANLEAVDGPGGADDPDAPYFVGPEGRS